MGSQVVNNTKSGKGKKTQLLIIGKAVELFARHGYDQASFQMIADELGLSQAAPLYHFKTKFGLFQAIVGMILVELRDLEVGFEQPPAKADRQLEAYLVALANWHVIKAAEGQILLLLYYFATKEKNFSILYQQLRTELCERIKKILKNLPDNIDTEASTALTLDFILGMSVSLLAGNQEGHAPHEIQSKVRAFTGAALGIRRETL